MAELRFEWDPRKSCSNAEKYGVTFTEAQSVFYDEFGLLLKDTEHSEQEDSVLASGPKQPTPCPSRVPLL